MVTKILFAFRIVNSLCQEWSIPTFMLPSTSTQALVWIFHFWVGWINIRFLRNLVSVIWILPRKSTLELLWVATIFKFSDTKSKVSYCYLRVTFPGKYFDEWNNNCDVFCNPSQRCLTLACWYCTSDRPKSFCRQNQHGSKFTRLLHRRKRQCNNGPGGVYNFSSRKKRKWSVFGILTNC